MRPHHVGAVLEIAGRQVIMYRDGRLRVWDRETGAYVGGLDDLDVRNLHQKTIRKFYDLWVKSTQSTQRGTI